MRRSIQMFFTSLLALMMIHFAQAGIIGTSIIIVNAAPTVGIIAATDPVTLSGNSTTTVWCNTTVTDVNGYWDIASVSAKLWNPAATTEGASNDNNNHYTNTSCSLSGGSGTTVNTVCSFAVKYYADAADWTCKITARDTNSAMGMASISTITVNSLKAMASDANLVFAAQSLDSTTDNANERNNTITNIGNIPINITIGGYGTASGDGRAMTCTTGDTHIPIANLKYNLTAMQNFTTNMRSIASDTSPATVGDFNLAQETVDGTPSTKNIYWKIQIPASDVGGSCTGTLVIAAV